MNRAQESLPTPGQQPSAEIVAGLWEVTKTFDSYQTRALAGVTLEIRRGEIFGLLGPAGSGKSITLRLLAGRLRPTEGKVKVFGRPPWRGAIRARIGYLPGKASRPIAAGWFGFLGRRFRPGRSGSRRATEKSSSTPQPGPALAQAVLGSRDLVLLDDPFAGRDEVGRREVKELILSLARRGKTIVFSSDSLFDTRDICDRVAVYYEGRIQAIGSLEELLATRDAIRFMAPVLPPATSERLLGFIRAELAGATVTEKTTEMRADEPRPGPAQTVPQAEPPATATAAETILAPLVKPVPPALSASESAPEPAGNPSDPVDHDKLADLTKPGVPASAPPAEKPRPK
jgi:ABC-2 type transport system ATP-binding protein